MCVPAARLRARRPVTAHPLAALTQLTMASDPTVLAFETGNELGGWTGDDYPPPVEWTASIAQLLHELAPDTLVLSGSYGVRKSELAIAGVDMVCVLP